MKQWTVAEETLLNENVFIANEVLAEVVYVLGGVYNVSKKDIALELSTLLSQDNIASSNVAIEALTLFADKNIDFVDALLCAYSIADEIRTFDKKLLKCIGSK